MEGNGGVHFFKNAQGVTVKNSHFVSAGHDYIRYEISGDYHAHNYENEEGFKNLGKVVVPDALHTSGLTARCHPGTREKIILAIRSWIEDKKTQQDVLWIYGATGIGKSTIMQEIAELYLSCEPKDRYFGGTFFFSRGKPGRDDDSRLFTTLAYQLCLCDPEMRKNVDRAMANNPHLSSNRPGLQLRSLIFEPLSKLSTPPSTTPFVIIDGLDECKSHEIQTRIIKTITDTLLTYDRRVRFIITSRSEAHIRDIFGDPMISPRTHQIGLDSLYNPERDIRLFLEERLNAITTLKSTIMSKVKRQWPSPSDIDYLVKKSCGQFLYASTVLKFVCAENTHPVTQLKTVLASTHATNVYSNMDELYTQILQTCPSPETLKRIFGLLLTLHCPQPPEVYDDILGLDPETEGVAYILHGLHSVIRFPNPSDDETERRVFERRLEYDKTRGLRFHHASFQDFLLDEKRSKTFFVDLSTAHATLVKSGFDLMTKWISGPWRTGAEEDCPTKETWGYLKHHMGLHLDNCEVDIVEDVLKDLNKFDVVFPPSRVIGDPIWDIAFDALHCIVTAFATILTTEEETRQQLLNPTNFHSEHSHWAQECVLNPQKAMERTDSPVLPTYIKFCAALDDFYKFILSSSNDIQQLLEKLPGITTGMGPIRFHWLRDLFSIEDNQLFQNRKFFNTWKNAFWAQHFALGGEKSGNDDVVLLLNPHFRDFLHDKSRSGPSRHPLTYLDNILRKCLESISISHSVSSGDHPMFQLIQGLKMLSYDKTCLQEAPVLNVDLLWSATRRLLDWIQREYESLRHSDRRGLQYRIRKDLADISTHIYTQILQVDTPVTGGRIITIYEPFRIAINRDLASKTPSTLSPPPSPMYPEQLMISETLLSMHGIRSSLLAFLTKPERAGKWCFTPVEYHTQSAEICLEHCDPFVSDISKDWRTWPSHKEWRYHLVRASPSETIFARLRSIHPGPWLTEGLPTGDSGAKKRSIIAIIDWLNISSFHLPALRSQKFPETPIDITERWRQILLDFTRLDRWRKARIGESAKEGVYPASREGSPNLSVRSGSNFPPSPSPSTSYFRDTGSSMILRS
ncbi:hypothetical protein JR316_0009057 [Psilocybe cubensis]|uniref:Uncharacterized protein n=1 Tax=Psilocybe cubensis TaxID=181762 RepID=A0ACB8GS89_PSICU|nr:hypothetical protein JR316_0009057 [Psilocybe cubensis]KAH9478600.1 hypothetical protein JR316_0009057 [Psilocybe cubensis]